MNGGGGFTWANCSEMMQNGIASAMAALLRHIGDDARNFLAGKEFRVATPLGRAGRRCRVSRMRMRSRFTGS